MPEIVVPKTYLIGETQVIMPNLLEYLRDTGQDEFATEIDAARIDGVPDMGILCSFYAKICYAALKVGKNKNVTRVRSIHDNVVGTMAQGHLSVFEHANINFITTDCSRVFTHELIRHRVGTAFSQTSGRYVRNDKLRFVSDPILDPYRATQNRILNAIEEMYKELVAETGVDKMTDFTQKKLLTSALRRFMPNGQANEMGWSVNIRSLRHLLMLRTAAGAEYEIRKIFGDVYALVAERYPLLVQDAKTRKTDGLIEVYGMKMQPYDQVAA